MTGKQPTASSDSALIARSRDGDMGAFGELWTRHAAAGRKVARLYTSTSDPDDLVSEAYVMVLQVLRRGSGPNDSFRPYLFTVIRNLAKRWGARRAESPVEMIADLPADIDVPADQEHGLDREMVAAAFAALPERWRAVLWYTEVEGRSPGEIAPTMKITPNSVAALAYRAREGLRQAWLQEHVKSAQAEGECAWALSKIGEHTRAGLGKRDASRMDAHLASCASCRAAALDVAHVGGPLRSIVAGVALEVGVEVGRAAVG